LLCEIAAVDPLVLRVGQSGGLSGNSPNTFGECDTHGLFVAGRAIPVYDAEKATEG
jgi:hypothetical protein